MGRTPQHSVAVAEPAKAKRYGAKPVRLPEIVQALQAIASEHPDSSRTLGEAIDRWLDEHVRAGLLKAKTITAYQRAAVELRERWGTLPLSTNWTREAADLVALRGQSAGLYVGVLRQVLHHVFRLGWVAKPPQLRTLLRRCKYAPVEVVYDEQDIVRFLAALDELERIDPGPDYLRQVIQATRDVLRLLTYTGCRMMEMASLRIEDVRGDHVRLRDSKTGPRSVQICGQAQVIIARQFVRAGWVFPGRGNKHIGARPIERRFMQARDHAGLRDGTVHTLRHSWCTIAIRNGVPSEAVQQITGHSTTYMLARYVHLQRRDAALACSAVAAAIDEGKRVVAVGKRGPAFGGEE